MEFMQQVYWAITILIIKQIVLTDRTVCFGSTTAFTHEF